MEVNLNPESRLVVSGLVEVFRKAYLHRQRKRAEDFFKCLEAQYERMTLEKQKQLIEHIETEAGQEALAEFADTITKTPSRRIRMATALLFCKSLDHDFDESETFTFISAMKDMNDDYVNFFIKASGLECQCDDSPYPRASVNINNYETFKECGWDEEAIFVYVNDLIRLRLFLPDPKRFSVTAGDDEGWAVWFGITNRSIKMASLLQKAEALLNND